MLLREQAEQYMNNLRTRQLRPAKPNTIMLYDSFLRTHILPFFGDTEVAEIKNAAMKKFAAHLAEKKLSAATSMGILTVIKSVIRSAVNEEGDLLFERTWNTRFIGAANVNPRKQKTPIIDAEGVEKAINDATGQFKALIALYAGTGLRMSEALALKRGIDDGKGSFWLPEERLLKIRSQVQFGKEQDPKTEAGTREVDLTKELNDFLLSVLSAGEGLVFKTQSGDFLSKASIYDVAKKTGIPGLHSLRRFRVTHLRGQQIPEDILEYWIGHSEGKASITDRYSKLAQNTTFRKEWVEKAGLGFNLKLEEKMNEAQ